MEKIATNFYRKRGVSRRLRYGTMKGWRKYCNNVNHINQLRANRKLSKTTDESAE